MSFFLRGHDLTSLLVCNTVWELINPHLKIIFICTILSSSNFSFDLLSQVFLLKVLVKKKSFILYSYTNGDYGLFVLSLRNYFTLSFYKILSFHCFVSLLRSWLLLIICSCCIFSVPPLLFSVPPPPNKYVLVEPFVYKCQAPLLIIINIFISHVFLER